MDDPEKTFTNLIKQPTNCGEFSVVVSESSNAQQEQQGKESKESEDAVSASDYFLVDLSSDSAEGVVGPVVFLSTNCEGC